MSMDGGQILTVALNMTAIAAVVMGIAVLARKTKSGLHRVFFCLTLALAGWIVTNSIFDSLSADWRYIDALVSYVFAGLTATLFMLFSAFLNAREKKLTTAFAVIGIFLALASGIPGIVSKGVSETGVVTTPYIGIYALYMLAYFGAGGYFLLKGRRHAVGVRHRQIRAVLVGLVGAIIGGVIFNLILPIMGNYDFVKVGPVFTILFVITFTYSILRHKLFDIRGAFARIIAYIASVAVIGLAFGAALAIIIERLGLDGTQSQLAIAVATVAITFIYPAVKTFFDNVTREVFFRKAYNTQQAIDQITNIFAQTTTLAELLEDSATALRQILGAQSVTISFTTNSAGQKVAYTTLSGQSEFPLPILTQARMLARQMKVISSDELADDEEDLIDELMTMSTAVVGQLHSPSALVGYIMIGYKQNGGSYGRQDLDFIDIVSDEFAIAIQSELRFQEIQEFNKELQHKIDEATRELQASNKKLQQLDEAKDEFISMASHQLRTPLTTVKGYLSMVLEGDVGKVAPAQKKVLEEAYDSAQRMVFLIGDFLNVSRLQTGKFIMEWMSADLSKIISQEISQLKASAASRKVELVYKAPSSFPQMTVDETKLRQVMMNFIDNAIYYSKPDTTIDISLVKLADEVVFKVTDHGIGVPMSERPRLFTKFYRASNAKKQRPDGTGIGLFMAKKVIVAHGGSVIFESKEGQGSTFGFRLPLKNDPEQFEQQPDNEQ